MNPSTNAKLDHYAEEGSTYYRLDHFYRLIGSGLIAFIGEEKLIDKWANYRVMNRNRL